ncbi:MAG: class I SAM-dependent methyltransferase [Alphaproteobacteria bacterium]
MTNQDTDYVPVLRYRWLTPLYDAAIALLTRESVWRKSVLNALSPQAGERILDIGCGTGSLLSLVRQNQPHAQLFGIDPDPEIIARAKEKLDAQSDIELINDMGDALGQYFESESLDAVVVTLVLHQVPVAGKEAIIKAVFEALKPGGQLIIGDYAVQPNWLMKQCFKIIQLLDGDDLTQPNADGVLTELATSCGFSAIEVRDVIKTPTGAISVMVCRKVSD